jgi:hypothetical protein
MLITSPVALSHQLSALLTTSPSRLHLLCKATLRCTLKSVYLFAEGDNDNEGFNSIWDHAEKTTK